MPQHALTDTKISRTKSASIPLKYQECLLIVNQKCYINSTEFLAKQWLFLTKAVNKRNIEKKTKPTQRVFSNA